MLDLFLSLRLLFLLLFVSFFFVEGGGGMGRFGGGWEALLSWGPFLERPSNLSGPISVFGDKCFLTEVNFC